MHFLFAQIICFCTEEQERESKRKRESKREHKKRREFKINNCDYRNQKAREIESEVEKEKEKGKGKGIRTGIGIGIGKTPYSKGEEYVNVSVLHNLNSKRKIRLWEFAVQFLNNM